MKPHPRMRKTIKWGGAAAVLVLVVVWTWSVYVWRIRIPNRFSLPPYAQLSPSLEVTLGEGHLRFDLAADVLPSPGETQWPGPWRLSLWPFYSRGASGHYLTIPLASSAMVFFFFAAVAWRLDTLAHRRTRRNLCQKCHYDRTGLAVDAVCPECGKLPA